MQRVLAFDGSDSQRCPRVLLTAVVTCSAIRQKAAETSQRRCTSRIHECRFSALYNSHLTSEVKFLLIST
eukprot:6176443-Pleurochrysis_carterae.AAC.5